MHNSHIITVKYVQGTDEIPGKVKIFSTWRKETVTIPMNNEAGSWNPKLETAQKYLEGKGLTITGASSTSTGTDYLISTSFNSIK